MSQALEKFDSRDSLLRKLLKLYDSRICQPVLSKASEGLTCFIDETSHCLTISTGHSRKDALNVLESLSLALVFLRLHFPPSLGSAIGKELAEELIDSLLHVWLTPSIPLSLSELHQCSNLQAKVGEFAQLVSSYHWPGHRSLTDWVEHVPQIWLEKRSASSLDAVRNALKMQRGPYRDVQRIERENISSDDAVLIQNGVNDGTAGGANEHSEPPTSSTNAAVEEEEDLSGWGFDEDPGEVNDRPSSPANASGNNDGATDALGWGEKGAEEDAAGESMQRAQRNGDGPAKDSAQRQEVTLTETYTITDIPDHLIDIISREVQAGEQLQTSKVDSFERISASSTLLSLPSLILAMFRAIAPGYYTSTLASGNMHLYNDCMFVVEKVRDLARSTSLNQLLRDCDFLEKFARNAYAREMDVQRTILGDLLDGAQGFVSCTRSPYSVECENAVSSSIDRLRAVHHDWSSILSRSALLQSTGSLLSTALDKIVKDIEDMEDISEAESQRLTAFCEQFSALEDLFMSENSRPCLERMRKPCRSLPSTCQLAAISVPPEYIGELPRRYKILVDRRRAQSGVHCGRGG